MPTHPFTHALSLFHTKFCTTHKTPPTESVTHVSNNPRTNIAVGLLFSSFSTISQETLLLIEITNVFNPRMPNKVKPEKSFASLFLLVTTKFGNLHIVNHGGRWREFDRVRMPSRISNKLFD